MRDGVVREEGRRRGVAIGRLWKMQMWWFVCLFEWSGVDCVIMVGRLVVRWNGYDIGGWKKNKM